MKIFFTSDLHFFHANIIKYCQRPYISVEEMNECLIKNFNSVVSNNDHVYFLGDFSLLNDLEKLSYIFSRLNGKQKFLIKGNHESKNALKLPWSWIKDYHEMSYDNIFITMMHYPLKTWNHKHHGGINLYGHCHSKTNKFEDRSMDVGVDANNYFPVCLDDILIKIKEIKTY